MARILQEKLSALYLHLLNSYFEQTYIGGFASSSFVFADCADSRSESVILFGLQSISLWLNLLSVRFIPVFLLLSVSFAVYVLDWWDLLWLKPMPCMWRQVSVLDGLFGLFVWLTPPAKVISRFELVSAKFALFHSPMANHCNSRCVWNPGLVCTDKFDLVCGMCICSSSYKTVVVEIGLKGRGLVIVNAHSLDHVIIL